MSTKTRLEVITVCSHATLSAISPHNIKNNIGLQLADRKPRCSAYLSCRSDIFVISGIREYQKGYFDRLEIGTSNPLSSCERCGAKKKKKGGC